MINAAAMTVDWMGSRSSGGDSMDALSRAIQDRARYLGETAERSTTATAINILRSLRAETSTVRRSPRVFGGRYSYRIEPTGFVSGWKRPGKNHPRGRRTVRAPGGKSLDVVGGVRVYNLAENYTRGEQLQVYTLSISNDLTGYRFYPARNGAEKIHCIARSEADVARFAEDRIRRRIGQYRGASRRALGLAMHQVAGGGGETGGDLAQVLARVVRCSATSEGFSRGVSRVSVADDLPAAKLALKNGDMSFQLAVRRAVNATVGLINRRGAVGLGEKLDTPFQEVRR